MPVSFQCPSCHETYSVSDQLVGRRLRCPNCDVLSHVVPELTTPEIPDSEGLTPLDSAGQPARWRVDEDAVELDAVDLVSPDDLHAPEDIVARFDMVSREDVSPAMSAVPANPPFPGLRLLEDEEPDYVPPPRRSRLGDTEMDMTPMVDVTFQLLIFFMITAAFALQKAKEIPKPEATDPSTNVVQQVSEVVTDFVIVRIDEFDTFTVIDINQDEDEAASVQDLYIKLRRAKTVEVSGKPPTKLRVESHADATYERVINALDAGNETGFAEIELAKTSEDAE